MSYNYPDDKGHFGIYGGRFASETLIPALDELNEAYRTIVPSTEFQQEFSMSSSTSSVVHHPFIMPSACQRKMAARRFTSSVRI